MTEAPIGDVLSLGVWPQCPMWLDTDLLATELLARTGLHRRVEISEHRGAPVVVVDGTALGSWIVESAPPAQLADLEAVLAPRAEPAVAIVVNVPTWRETRNSPAGRIDPAVLSAHRICRHLQLACAEHGALLLDADRLFAELGAKSLYDGDELSMASHAIFRAELLRIIIDAGVVVADQELLTQVRFPRPPGAIAEVELVEWCFAAGATIRNGDPLCRVAVTSRAQLRAVDDARETLRTDHDVPVERSVHRKSRPDMTLVAGTDGRIETLLVDVGATLRTGDDVAIVAARAVGDAFPVRLVPRASA